MYGFRYYAVSHFMETEGVFSTVDMKSSSDVELHYVISDVADLACVTSWRESDWIRESNVKSLMQQKRLRLPRFVNKLRRLFCKYY